MSSVKRIPKKAKIAVVVCAVVLLVGVIGVALSRNAHIKNSAAEQAAQAVAQEKVAALYTDPACTELVSVEATAKGREQFSAKLASAQHAVSDVTEKSENAQLIRLIEQAQTFYDAQQKASKSVGALFDDLSEKEPKADNSLTNVEQALVDVGQVTNKKSQEDMRGLVAIALNEVGQDKVVAALIAELQSIQVKTDDGSIAQFNTKIASLNAAIPKVRNTTKQDTFTAAANKIRDARAKALADAAAAKNTGSSRRSPSSGSGRSGSSGGGSSSSGSSGGGPVLWVE